MADEGDSIISASFSFFAADLGGGGGNEVCRSALSLPKDALRISRTFSSS